MKWLELLKVPAGLILVQVMRWRARVMEKVGGYSVSKVPFYEYHPYKEVTSVEDHSIQGIIEKFIAWIVNQNPRHAQLKIGTYLPTPIVAPEVKK